MNSPLLRRKKHSVPTATDLSDDEDFVDDATAAMPDRNRREDEEESGTESDDSKLLKRHKLLIPQLREL